MNRNKFLVRVALVCGLALLLAPLSVVMAIPAWHVDPDRQDPWGNCASCHGSDMGNKSAEGTCAQCHNEFFEPDLPPLGHHMTGRDDPYNNCTDCHGSELTGFIRPSCYTCHGQLWPDPPSNEPPTADLNGPYAALVDEVVTFDGSGSTDDAGIAT